MLQLAKWTSFWEMSFFGPDLFCFFLLQRPESVTAASDVRDFLAQFGFLKSSQLFLLYQTRWKDAQEFSSVIVVCVWHDTRAHYWTLPLCCQGKLVFCQLLQKRDQVQDQVQVLVSKTNQLSMEKVSEDYEAAAAVKARARLSAYYTRGPNQVVGYVTFFTI